ncbi:hypothetical protein NA57DRAFT_55262 [Rhizodiscina lignyota]|uniref:Uncharacterized protein n=1 Tax=Rhizodiscina lignyota TaxID=1504668 RepID=A0A9P4IHI0_9PEZI|nr:hypothetical protein NA57DRAFT_55262 [Rhizodiscina lignyota]
MLKLNFRSSIGPGRPISSEFLQITLTPTSASPSKFRPFSSSHRFADGEISGSNPSSQQYTSRRAKIASSQSANQAIQSLSRSPPREPSNSGTVRAGTPNRPQRRKPGVGGLRFGPAIDAPVGDGQRGAPAQRAAPSPPIRREASGPREPTAPVVRKVQFGQRTNTPSRFDPPRSEGVPEVRRRLALAPAPAQEEVSEGPKSGLDIFGRTAEEEDLDRVEDIVVQEIDLEQERETETEHRTGALAASHGVTDNECAQKRAAVLDEFRLKEENVRNTKPVFPDQRPGKYLKNKYRKEREEWIAQLPREDKFFPHTAETVRQLNGLFDGGRYTISKTDNKTTNGMVMAAVERYTSFNQTYAEHQRGGILKHVSRALHEQDVAQSAQAAQRR